MRQLLLVEDDVSLGETLKERLDLEGYRVEWVDSASQARRVFAASHFDLIILDIGLPDGSGLELAKEIKQDSTTPFIFVTAQNSADIRLEGYELGAEEFIPKPFQLKELLIRVKHVLDNHAPAEVKKIENVVVDFAAMQVMVDGKDVQLSTRDFKILHLLLSEAPRVVSRDQILDKIWGEEKFPSARTIDNCVVRIRQALGAVGTSIESVRGVGYRWKEER